MNAERAMEIFQSKDTIPVHLDSGESVWIEKVDKENGVATVQIGQNPVNTQTVAVERLQEAH
ncbi:H-type small acid-soluble spore protein [Cohnella sp. CFH 77786]|uniref:H-type small acid-soluble spore protein n=1 Tax=Cohnella sp. CFH 77786 TaxID=2662265 RepID=UPI001C609930|nr:H-type small acid-soluble spore protein [Cohnella sp. CFH 77786]MBW5448330.1 H-type small acid-soluble spore protein [Cohnella sp. CFH 77786]